MIDIGEELDGYGEESNESQIKSNLDNGYLPKGGHVRLSDLKKTGFNVGPKENLSINTQDLRSNTLTFRIASGLAGATPTYNLPPDPFDASGWKSILDSD